MTEAIGPWLSSLPRYYNKSERNYRGKCLGWPVTSYGTALHTYVHTYIRLFIF